MAALANEGNNPRMALLEGAMQNPHCLTCRDDGFYFRIPNHMNPFVSSIEVTARNMRKIICTCKAGQEYERAPYGANTAKAPD